MDSTRIPQMNSTPLEQATPERFEDVFPKAAQFLYDTYRVGYPQFTYFNTRIMKRLLTYFPNGPIHCLHK